MRLEINFTNQQELDSELALLGYFRTKTEVVVEEPSETKEVSESAVTEPAAMEGISSKELEIELKKACVAARDASSLDKVLETIAKHGGQKTVPSIPEENWAACLEDLKVLING